MDPVLAEVYSLVIPSAPYVIVAYVGMWLAMCIFLILTLVKMKNAEKQIKVLEEIVAQKGIKQATSDAASVAAGTSATDAASAGVAVDKDAHNR